MLMNQSGCDSIEIRLSENDLHYKWTANCRPEKSTTISRVRWQAADDGRVIPSLPDDSDLERLCSAVALHHFDASRTYFTKNGSFWTGDTWESLNFDMDQAGEGNDGSFYVGGHYRSLAVIRFFEDDETIGLLSLKSERTDFFDEDRVEYYESIAQDIGMAIADWRAESALRERVKELTCLYGIAQLTEPPGSSLEEILPRIASLLPPGWQYPDIAAARITLDGKEYCTTGFKVSQSQQAADIVVHGKKRGTVAVVYFKEQPEIAVDTFLPEEQKLIQAVAREIALIVERKEIEGEKARLREQLIHADRLATIGQLAAGVAHELNEPLGSILGFAQLASASKGMRKQARQDVEKIVTAALYAREVIKKLMVFARQMPPKKHQVDLNQILEDGLYFLEARCVKAGINVVRELEKGLPKITADPAQITQVLVNLAVNALQAMPEGGTLVVKSWRESGTVLLSVKDTGVGMGEEILDRIFLPFFTTKDVNEGTGLGLAVVHGITKSHGGAIDVQSRISEGSTFTIRLPVALSEDEET